MGSEKGIDNPALDQTDVILEEPKKSGEPTEPVFYEPEDKSHLTKWDRCKIWCCNAYHPYKKLPMLKWIQSYQLSYIIPDIVAGLTIGLMLIPQSLAYAELAGLDAYFGLYTAFLGVSIYTVLGTSGQCAIGPTAISSALMIDFLRVDGTGWPSDPRYTGVSAPQIAQVLSFFMGVILGGLGLIQLGFLVNFISSSVVTGFIQAASFTIPLGQLKKIFGVQSSRPGFIGKIVDICEEVFTGKSNYYDLGVGLGSIAMLIGLKELKGRSANWKYLQQDKIVPIILSKLIWFLGTAKAAIVTIVMMIVAVCTETPEQVENFLAGCLTGGRIPVNDTTGIPPENCTTLTLTMISDVLPPTMGPPMFGYEYAFCNNGDFDAEARYPEGFTVETYLSENNITLTCGGGDFLDVWHVSFSDMIGVIGIGLLVQPIISFLEIISLGKSFAKKKGYQIDPTQEMVALGFSNIGNSFSYGAYPVTAGMSRSAVNFQANAATQLSAWVTAGVILLAACLIADIFVYIPSAALAAVIIVSASSLFNWEDWKKVWRLNKVDMIPFVACFIFCLRKSSTGLIVGIIVHLVILLGKFMFPVDRTLSKGNRIILQGQLMYPSGDSLSEKMQKNGARLPDYCEFIVDFTKVTDIDAGAAFGIVDGIQFVIEGNKTLKVKLVGINEHHVGMLKECGLPKSVMINGADAEDVTFAVVTDNVSTTSSSLSSNNSIRKRNMPDENQSTVSSPNTESSDL